MLHIYLILGIGLANDSAPAAIAIKTAAGAPLRAVSADSLAVLEGSAIAPGFGQAAVGLDRLPESLGGVRVLVGVPGREVAAPLVSVAPNRIEFLVPKFAPGPGHITVRARQESSGRATHPISVAYVAASPAVVYSQGYPSITDAEAREIRSGEPLEQGREYILYATGLGRADASSIALYVNGMREDVKQSSLVMAGIYQVRFLHRGAGSQERPVHAAARLIAGGHETGFTVLAK